VLGGHLILLQTFCCVHEYIYKFVAVSQHTCQTPLNLQWTIPDYYFSTGGGRTYFAGRFRVGYFIEERWLPVC